MVICFMRNVNGADSKMFLVIGDGIGALILNSSEFILLNFHRLNLLLIQLYPYYNKTNKTNLQ